MEVLCCSPGRCQHHIPTASVWIGTTCMLLITSVRDRGVYIDSDISMWAHMIATVRACCAALRQLHSVRRCLSDQALLMLIRAVVVSKVDYCCSVLVSISGHLTDRLQSVLNTATRLVFSIRCSNTSCCSTPTSTGYLFQSGYASASLFWCTVVWTIQRCRTSRRASVGQLASTAVVTSAIWRHHWFRVRYCVICWLFVAELFLSLHVVTVSCRRHAACSCAVGFGARQAHQEGNGRWEACQWCTRCWTDWPTSRHSRMS